MNDKFEIKKKQIKKIKPINAFRGCFLLARPIHLRSLEKIHLSDVRRQGLQPTQGRMSTAVRMTLEKTEVKLRVSNPVLAGIRYKRLLKHLA